MLKKFIIYLIAILSMLKVSRIIYLNLNLISTQTWYGEVLFWTIVALLVFWILILLATFILAIINLIKKIPYNLQHEKIILTFTLSALFVGELNWYLYLNHSNLFATKVIILVGFNLYYFIISYLLRMYIQQRYKDSLS